MCLLIFGTGFIVVIVNSTRFVNTNSFAVALLFVCRLHFEICFCYRSCLRCRGIVMFRDNVFPSCFMNTLGNDGFVLRDEICFLNIITE